MAQLSKEHFDQQIKGFVTKTEFSARITDQTRQLKEYTDTLVSDLRGEIREGFESVDEKLDAIKELLDVRNRVEKLEAKVTELQRNR